MLKLGKEQNIDTIVQGSVAIASGIIIFAALFLPWLDHGKSAILGLTQAKSQAQLAVPMTLILLSILTIFSGTIHILGYKIGMQLAMVTSAAEFFISIMVIVVTLASADTYGGRTITLLVGPWIGAAGAVFGAISSKLQRK